MNVHRFVEEHTKVTHEGPNAMKFSFTPGDGRKYEILVIPFIELGLGCLGYISNGHLIVNGWTGDSYLFSASAGYLTKDYVDEKLFGARGSIRQDTLAIITALVGYALDRQTNVTTIEEFGKLEDVI